MPLTKKSDAGDYIDDFSKSKAPQFKGKSKKKKRQMAIAAYLSKKNELADVINEVIKEYDLNEGWYSRLNKVVTRAFSKLLENDPKKGSGKKPKGSGRRLYTDENPKDTVRIKFATTKDARATVRKVKRVRKSYARKIQILTVGEQRARVMGKKTVASIFRAGKASLRRANNAKKNKTKKARPKTRKSRR